MAKKSKTSSDTHWDFASLIDLEYQIFANKKLSTAELNERDASVSKEIRAAISSGEIQKGDRRTILWRWLENLQREDGPLDSFHKVMSMTHLLGKAGLGFLGASYVWMTLDVQPASDGVVNVQIFWLSTTVLPWILPVLAAWLWSMFDKGAKGRKMGFFEKLFLSFTLFLVDRLPGVEKFEENSKKIREILNERMDHVIAHLTAILCSLGLFCTIGICVAIFSFGIVEDQVYGWKSHSDEEGRVDSLFRVVRLVALPWSWIESEGDGFPTREQIRASQLPVAIVNQPALRSARSAWNHFFGWSVFFYGVLPRFLLLSACRIRSQSIYRNESFGADRFAVVCKRLTASAAYQKSDREEEEPEDMPDLSRRDLPNIEGESHLLFPFDIEDTSKAAAMIREPLMKQHQIYIGTAIRLPALPSEQSLMLESMNAPPKSVLLVKEAFSPPTCEFTDQIATLRRLFGSTLPVRIILVGRFDGRAFSSPTADYSNVWIAYVNRMRDHFLSCLSVHFASSK